MKNRNYRWYLSVSGFLLLFFFISSCKKEDATTGERLFAVENTDVYSCTPSSNGLLLYNRQENKLSFTCLDADGTETWKSSLLGDSFAFYHLVTLSFAPAKDKGMCAVFMLKHLLADSAITAVMVRLNSAGYVITKSIIPQLADPEIRFDAFTELPDGKWRLAYDLFDNQKLFTFSQNCQPLYSVMLPFDSDIKKMIARSDGATCIYNSNSLLYVVDSIGFIKWSYQFDIPSYHPDSGSYYVKLSDMVIGENNEVYVAGYSNYFDRVADQEYHFFVVHFNENGTRIAGKEIQTGKNSYNPRISFEQDHHIWLAGSSTNLGTNENEIDDSYGDRFFRFTTLSKSMVCRLNSNLDTEWLRFFGNSWGSESAGISVPKDGRVLMTGRETAVGNKNNIKLFKQLIDASGNVVF